VRRLELSVLKAKIVQISHSRGDGGTQPGDHLRRLGAQLGQVAPRHPSQHEPIWRITAIHVKQLDHAWMGQRLQHGDLGRQLGAVPCGAGPLDHSLLCSIM
jgi:hypothetical protein